MTERTVQSVIPGVRSLVRCSVRTGTVRTLLMAALAVALWLPCYALAQAPGLPAFPGAEGFGAQAVGGRGGRVIEVTNLNADGPGSLREAVAAEGPRIVVFRVAGSIDVGRGLSIRNPYITIAGQTAPGDGICLKTGALSVTAHDVIIRHLRVRPGDGPLGTNPENRDCIGLSGDAYNVMIDHCSASWGIDENMQTWGRGHPRDVTFQWCVTSESLLDSLHVKGPHGMGMILGSGGNTVTVHHCLFAHNNQRNPYVNDGEQISEEPAITDFRNNLIYNYTSCSVFDGNKRVNYVGNYIKMGPNRYQDSPRVLHISTSGEKLFFVKDNIWPGSLEKQMEDWMVIGPSTTPPPDGLLSPEPIATPPVTTESAADAYETVLRFAGATLPVRDVVDDRVVQEVRTGTGKMIDSQKDVGGWPEYKDAPAPADSDHDGMPDDWERQYGLAPDDPSDGPQDLDSDGYTNVEEYLNATNPTEETSGASVPQREPVVQQGNEALRFGVARVTPERVVYDPAAREALVSAVKVSGQEAADYLGIRFVPIAPGKFVKQEPREIEVTLTKPFEIGAYEVTQGQWTAVMGTKPWLDKEFAQDAPENGATYVSWDDCQEFLARLNACGERRYRLPTEAEWIYACRAGSTDESVFWFPEDQMDEYAWHYANTVAAGEDYAHLVGQKKPNPWDLFDMAGNVHEWCHDWHHYSYWRQVGSKIDPTGAEPGSYHREYHALRGGSFYNTARQIHHNYSYRSHHRPDYRNFDVGFRVVRLAP